MITRLWHHLTLNRKVQVICILLLMVVASIAELVSIGMVVPFLSVISDPSLVYDNTFLHPYLVYFNINNASALVLPITVAFAAAALLAGLVRVVLMVVQTKVGYLIGAELGVQIFSKTLHQPYEIHLENNSSEVIAGIAHKTTALVQQGIIAILTIISSTLLLVSIIFVLVLIDYKISVISFAIFGGIYGGMIITTRPVIEAKGKLVTRMQGSVVKNIQEGLGAIRDILLDGSQSVYLGAFEKSEFSLRRAQIVHIILTTTPKYIVEALGISLIAVLAYVLTSDGTSTAGIFPTLGALALGAQRLLPVLQQIYATWSSFRAGQAAFSDALNLLDQPVKKIAMQSRPFEFKYGISLDKLSFHYRLDNNLVLDTVDLEIPLGSRVGIIGSTGSGKSTILDIFMGLLHPTSGNLMVDNVVLDENNIHLWQKMVAHVPQTIFLADATIAENIAFGELKSKIDYPRLQSAVKLAQLSSTIDQLSDGYESMVGERGVRLSGGQRQRIGIARALYKGASTIIFDEATSALDSVTESEIMRSISELPKEITMIIVAHRTSTLVYCDYIYKLDNAKLTPMPATNTHV